ERPTKKRNHRHALPGGRPVRLSGTCRRTVCEFPSLKISAARQRAAKSFRKGQIAPERSGLALGRIGRRYLGGRRRLRAISASKSVGRLILGVHYPPLPSP